MPFDRFPLATVFLAGALVAGSAVAADLPGGLRAGASVEGIDEYRLPNGLQVLLVPDDSKPTTTVNLTYRVGSRQESYGETGMAHLLEHMHVQGLAAPSQRECRAARHARPGQANGSTWLRPHELLRDASPA